MITSAYSLIMITEFWPCKARTLKGTEKGLEPARPTSRFHLAMYQGQDYSWQCQGQGQSIYQLINQELLSILSA